MQMRRSLCIFDPSKVFQTSRFPTKCRYESFSNAVDKLVSTNGIDISHRSWAFQDLDSRRRSYQTPSLSDEGKILDKFHRARSAIRDFARNAWSQLTCGHRLHIGAEKRVPS